MRLRVSLPCRTSHTQIGSWKHLNTAPVQEPSKYSQCGLGRGLRASGSSLGFPVLGAPARTDGYDLALRCSSSTLVRARNSSASLRYLPCSSKGGGKERSSAPGAGA